MLPAPRDLKHNRKGGKWEIRFEIVKNVAAYLGMNKAQKIEIIN